MSLVSGCPIRIWVNLNRDKMYVITLIFIPKQIERSGSKFKNWVTLGDMNSIIVGHEIKWGRKEQLKRGQCQCQAIVWEQQSWKATQRKDNGKFHANFLENIWVIQDRMHVYIYTVAINLVSFECALKVWLIERRTLNACQCQVTPVLSYGNTSREVSLCLFLMQLATN